MPSYWSRISPLVVPVLGASVVAAAIWSREPGIANATVAPIAPAAPVARAAATYAPSARFPLVVRTDRFLLLSDADPAWVREQGEWLERVATVFEDEARALGFRVNPPGAPLRVMLFAQRDEFIRFAREVDSVDARWMGGYYEPVRNRVVAYDDRSSESFRRIAHAPRAQADARRATRAKLAHEAAHLLAFNSGVQVRGVSYPEWFTEGLAERVARLATGEHSGAACASAHRPAHPGRTLDPWAGVALSLREWGGALARAASPDDHHARYALWAAAFDALADSRPGAIAALASSIHASAGVETIPDDRPTRLATAPTDD